MRKFFTFVICALCAVSLQATVVEIGTGGSTGTTLHAPFITEANTYTSISQQLYLASELLNAGATANDITAISFFYTSTTEMTRSNIEVWMSATTNTNLSASEGDKWMYSESNKSAGTKVFSGSVTTVANGWYTITLDNAFNWNGSKNIVITINDKTNTRTATSTYYHKSFTASSCRTIYKSAPTKDASNTYDIQGTATKVIPVIKFTFAGGEDPDPTPTINNPSPSSLEYGTIYLDEGNVEKTFKVTASDLTNDITLTTNASAGVTISPSEIAKDNTDLAVDGVAVTVTLSKGYPFPITNPTVTIASEGATSKSVTINATEGSFSSLSTMESLNTNGYFLLNFDATISSINSEEKTMTIKKVSPKNANYALIDGQATFAVGGIFNGLKGKYENEVFKIFSYTKYTAPTPTSVVEVDEDIDHSTDWTDIEDGENVSTLTIKRTIVPSEWNTIVLPIFFNSTEISTYFGSNTQIMEFNEAIITSSNITLNFASVSEIEAGTPYLIKPTQAIANPLNLQNRSFTKTVTPVEKNGICFEGVLVPTVIDGGDGSDYIIVGANNTLLHPTGTGTIKGMRAYFHVVGPAAKAALKTAKVSMNTGNTTEMVLIKDNQVKPYKTMINDQIVIVNEGKQINILGQTVK